MPSVVVNVVKYERANYSSPGDLLTTITTSHQHIIITTIACSLRITTLSSHVQLKESLFSHGNDSTSLENQHNQRRHVKSEERERETDTQTDR